MLARIGANAGCIAQAQPWRVFVREERETKTAKSRQCSSTTDVKHSSSGYGAIAQLGERVLCKHEVVGSIPSGSTRWN